MSIQLLKVCGTKLKEARGSMPLTTAARHIGISRQVLWTYENERSIPPAPVLAALCQLYGCRMESVVTEDISVPAVN